MATIGSSNLDVSGIVSQLMSIERQPIDKIDKKISGLNTKISDIGKLKNAYNTLQTALQTLTNPNNFSSLLGISSLSSEPSTQITASKTGSPSTGTYNLNISQIAKNQQIASNATFVNSSAIVSSTTFSIDISTGTISNGTLNNGIYSGATFTQNTNPIKTITFAANATLNDIKNTINAANVNLNANIVNDGTGFKLTLNNTQTGLNQSLKIVASTPEASAVFNYDPANTQNFIQTQAAQDLTGTINGLNISSPTNTLDQVIENLSITVSKPSEQTITVSQDLGSLNTFFQTLTTSWNSLNSTYNSLTAYNQATKTGASLFTDSFTKTSFSRMRSSLFSTPLNNKFMSDFGVNLDKNGVASFNATQLQKTLTTNPTIVLDTFSSNKTNSLSSVLNQINNLIGDNGLQSSIDSVNKQIKKLNTDKDNLSSRLVTTEQRLKNQYSKLDSLLSNSTATSNLLTQKLNNP